MRKNVKPGTRLLLSIAVAWCFILAGSAGIITTGYFSQMSRSVSMIAAVPAGTGGGASAEGLRAAAQPGGRSLERAGRPEGRPEGADPARHGGSGLSAASLAKVGGYAGLLAGFAWLAAAIAALVRKAPVKEASRRPPTLGREKEAAPCLGEPAGSE